MNQIFTTLLFYFLISSFTFTLQAQNLEIGLQAGFGRSTINAHYGTFEAQEGFQVGIISQYNFTPKWSLTSKITYDQKGFEGSFIQVNNIGLEGGLYQENFHYLNLPVMLKRYFGRKVKAYAQLGGYYGLLLFATYENSESITSNTQDYPTSDWGLAYGLGVEVPASQQLKFFIEWEGQLGFTHIDRDSAHNQSDKVGFGIRYVFGE